MLGKSKKANSKKQNNSLTVIKTESYKSLKDSQKIKSSNQNFPLVGIGGSAGSLQALEEFFHHLPSSTHSDISYIVITHLDPNHVSSLPAILQKTTKLKVIPITDEIKLEPNCIYVSRLAKNVYIKNGTLLKFAKHKKYEKIYLPIDFFFQSLANEQGRKIIGIILSGTGMDGTQGIKDISTAGGLVIAQDPKNAQFDNMPKSAIETGLVDYIASPSNIPKQVYNYLNYNLLDKTLKESETLKGLQPIFNLLRTQMGHDFSLYKCNTVCRRIEKQMNLHQISTMKTYARHLQNNPQEVKVLFKDLLIGVTNFFRNPEAFGVLKKIIAAKLLKDQAKDRCIRVWVPACATGEEVYSLAILFQECMEEVNRYYNIQIYGTDIDEAAIEIARAGIYSASIIADVSQERLKRFFTKEDKMYKISKDIRKMAIFAVQNIIKDPPFTKLDLLSCRNLLIYFTSELQKKILPIFHYSLNYSGTLFLGSAENIAGFTDFFNTLDKKWKIFEKRLGSSSSSLQNYLEFPTTPQLEKMEKTMELNAKIAHKEKNLPQFLESILLENYAPTCIIVTEEGNTIYIHGRTGKYLEPASGIATLNVLQMAKPGLKLKLAAALRQISTQKKQVIYNNLQVKEGEIIHHINLTVRPFKEFDPKRNLSLIIIENAGLSQQLDLVHPKHITHEKLVQRLVSLEVELKQSRENLQTTIEELETSNEELKSSNEEMQSTNEELQSANEELETSKEELQSLNEELTTVNAELEARIEELSSTNDDIQNLLYSTEIATIFLDTELNIKRFTPKATELTNLIQTDIGRPISDIVSKLKYDTLIKDAQKVLETLSCKTIEVQNREQKWYQVRIMPYRTLSNIIDGVVITFLNIDVQKQAEEKVRQLNVALENISDYTNSLIDVAHDALVILDEKFDVLTANSEFCKFFDTKLEKIQGQNIYNFFEEKTDITKLHEVLDRILSEKKILKNYPKNFKINNKDRKTRLNAKIVGGVGSNIPTILLTLKIEQ
jgi:two-component system CheB/CheR fusion protein